MKPALPACGKASTRAPNVGLCQRDPVRAIGAPTLLSGLQMLLPLTDLGTYGLEATAWPGKGLGGGHTEGATALLVHGSEFSLEPNASSGAHFAPTK